MLKIIQSYLLETRKQYRFPRSKSKRIRKKWSKNPSNFKYFPNPNVFVSGDRLYVHPETYKHIQASLEKTYKGGVSANDYQIIYSL